MAKLRRSKRKQNKQSHSLTSQNLASPAKSDTSDSESETDFETCKACNKRTPPVKRYSETKWIACDVCLKWWHAECACLTISTIDKFCKYKLPYTCPLCVLECSPWITANCASTGGQTVPKESTNTSSSEGTAHIHKETDKTIQTQTTSRKKVVVVDNISDPTSYHSSEEIRRETKKFDNLKGSEFSYSLPRGGVALQFKTEEEAVNAIRKWPKEAFGGNCEAHSPKYSSQETTAFLKNTSNSVTETTIEEILSKHCKVKKVQRLFSRETARPLPVVKVVFSSNSDLEKATKLNLHIKSVNGKGVYIEKSRCFRIIRCYNCQEFGHIAKLCKKSEKCENCGSTEHRERNCKENSKCANCEASHKASSPNCPRYISEVTKCRACSLC